MPTVQEAFDLALHHHSAGRLPQAEGIYRAILDSAPNHPDTLHLLGVLAYQRGQAAEAHGWISKAVALQGREPNYHQNLALTCRALGRLDEAADCYGRILALDPRRADALACLGAVYATRRDMDKAVAAWQAALGVEPTNEAALIGLAGHLRDTGKVEEAAERFRTALRQAPDNVNFATNLGIMLRQLNRLDEADRLYRTLLARDPGQPGALHGLADGLLRQERIDEALVGFRRAVRADPLMSEAHDGEARALEKLLRYEEAAASFRRFLCLRPQESRAWYNLGTMQENLIRFLSAIRLYDRALRVDRAFTLAWSKIGHKLMMCDWRDYEENERAILRHIRHEGGHIPAIPLVYMASTPTDQLLNARRQIEHNELPKVEAFRSVTVFAAPRTPRERLTVGYVSGDFREHAVAFLIAELFELHDRARFRIAAYSNGPVSDQPMRHRLEQAFDHLVDVRDLSPLDMARRIHEDGVDILVDLSGHTRHSRLEVFALRPAPVQVTYLGYPGTTGADFFDYILVDPIVAPPEHQPFYSERLFPLPDCYQPNDRKRQVAPVVPSRAECGLPDEGLVFCSFNHAPKITPTVFSIWMRVLAAVPGSVLWLLMPEEPAVDNLRRAAAARGIDPARLIFAPRRILPFHLARFRVADLFLDTFPYNAHTTASDSLWVGCPILTCMGDTFPSRVAASLLVNVGVPELITRSLAEYEETAIRLAHDPDQLKGFRDRLKANRDRCALFDTPRFTRNLERGYERMWEAYRTGGVAWQPATSSLVGIGGGGL
jgi:protein O-GlcNAc transferase